MKRIFTSIMLITTGFTLHGAVITVGPAGADHTTITAGASAAQPGDTVLVNDGIYDERITLSRSGTAERRIVVMAATKHGARMQGFDVQADYVTIDGFEITGINGMHAVKNGSEYKGVFGRSHVHVTDNYIHDIACPGKYAVHTGRYGRVTGNLIKRVGAGIFARDNSLVEDNRILDLNPEKPNIHVFFLGDSITIRGNYLWDTNNSVSSNSGHFFTTWDDYHDIQSHDILIENNIGFNTTHASEPVCGKYGSCARFTYRNNLFVNTYFVGIMAQYVDDVVIYNNTFINCGSYPVWFSKSYGRHVVKNNLFAVWGERDSIRIPSWNTFDKAVFIKSPDNSSIPDADYNYVAAPVSGYPDRYTIGIGGPHDGTFDIEQTFVNPDPFDTAAADFSLKPGAAVINAGCDMGITYDIAGNDRPAGGAFDIGAYEYPEGTAAARDRIPMVRQGASVRPLAVDGLLRITADTPLGTVTVHDMTGSTVWHTVTAARALSVNLAATGIRPGRYVVTSAADASLHRLLVLE